jgi:hypothetical protein
MPLEKVRIARGEMSVRGILAAPGGPGPFPGIVMIPTIKALDDFAAECCRAACGREVCNAWSGYFRSSWCSACSGEKQARGRSR